MAERRQAWPWGNFWQLYMLINKQQAEGADSGPALAFETSKPAQQSHTFSNATKPPNPFKTVSLTGDQAFKYMSLSGHSPSQILL